MAKDYYVVLGVKRTASPGRIKRAYRELAKKYHPDAGQPDSDAARFREVSRAYETLADAHRRRRYDAELSQTSAPAQAAGRGTRRSRTPGVSVAPVEAVGEQARKDPGPQPETDVAFEVILSPAEAAGGGVFPIHLPVAEPCPECTGSGGLMRFFCVRCGGRGVITTEREVGLNIPPGTPHGLEATLRLPTTGRGERRVYVRVRVDPGA